MKQSKFSTYLISLAIATSLVLAATSLAAECVEGDCQNGWGRYEETLNGRVVEVYEGEWRDGLRDGSGTLSMYTSGGLLGLRYTGSFDRGSYHGPGREVFFRAGEEIGNAFEGNFEHGSRSGRGVHLFYNIRGAVGLRAEGSWEGNRLNGTIVRFRLDGSVASRFTGECQYMQHCEGEVRRFDRRGREVSVENGTFTDYFVNIPQNNIHR